MKRATRICLMMGVALPVALTGLTGLTGCQSGNDYERSTGEYIDDKTVASRVKSALNDNEQYKFDDVNVDSFKGTVQLSGFVNTDRQKRMAGEIAEKVQGAKAVKNNITVKEDVKN